MLESSVGCAGAEMQIILHVVIVVMAVVVVVVVSMV